MPAEPPRELTISEAAELHGIPRRSVARAAERGQIPSRQIGNFWVIDAEAARLYAAVHEARRALDEYTASFTEAAKASA